MLYMILKVIFLIIGIIGTSFIIPEAVAVYCKEYTVLPAFIIPMVISWIIAAFFLIFKPKQKTQLTVRSSFIIVAVAWISAAVFGAVPFLISGAIPNFTNAIFESISGFTTTGATILTDIESLPRSINLWRCQTHWLGGMGIVALTVALFPILGIGGFQLIKAETTGPEKGKFTPKITTTAKYLWFIYLGFTVLETVLLKICGMDFIDSLSHAFSTLGTGGFSTRNNSIASYNSRNIDIICTIFMFIASINFTLYYFLLKGRFKEIFTNTEFRVFLAIVITAIAAITIIEIKDYGSFFNSLRYSAFQALTILSTTGFATADYTAWQPAAQSIILLLFFIGGSSGSTAGGIKIIRWTILGKQFNNEMRKLIHPHGVYSIRLNKSVGRKDVVFSVSAFIFIYFMLIFITTFFTSLMGIDIFTSFSGAVSMIGNVGPAFNKLGPSYNMALLPTAVKWWYSVIMLAGRLEIFTLIIFLFPEYYKR